MERLKALLAEHCGFSYNTVAETYKCRAFKLQYDFVEIDRRFRNDIVLSVLEWGADCIDREVCVYVNYCLIVQ